MRWKRSLRNCERSRVLRFSGKFKMTSALVFSLSRSAICSSRWRIRLRSLWAEIQLHQREQADNSHAGAPAHPQLLGVFVRLGSEIDIYTHAQETRAPTTPAILQTGVEPMLPPMRDEPTSSFTSAPVWARNAGAATPGSDSPDTYICSMFR